MFQGLLFAVILAALQSLAVRGLRARRRAAKTYIRRMLKPSRALSITCRSLNVMKRHLPLPIPAEACVIRKQAALHQFGFIAEERSREGDYASG
jgi:hypothetical protein